MAIPGDPESSDAAAPRRRAWARALRLMARRPHSAAEIEQALARRGEPDDVVRGTLDRLRASGLLDDAAVADTVVRDAARRDLGPRRVARTLLARGVSAELRQAAVAVSAADEAARARSLIARRFPSGLEDDRRGVARALRWLVGRGFSVSAARQALAIDFDLDGCDEGDL